MNPFTAGLCFLLFSSSLYVLRTYCYLLYNSAPVRLTHLFSALSQLTRLSAPSQAANISCLFASLSFRLARQVFYFSSPDQTDVFVCVCVGRNFSCVLSVRFCGTTLVGEKKKASLACSSQMCVTYTIMTN